MPLPADLLELDSLASTLLDASAGPARWQRSCEAFHARCLERVPEPGQTAVQLASGKALSPADAARCVLDHKRTAAFVQAVESAIVQCLRRRPDGGVEVLYAGCGPLAPLALILARRFRGRGVRFTLVDIHGASLDGARRLFELADATGTLADTICADAATLRLSAEFRPDILIAEVMQRALAHEPQMAVLANLAAQCAAEVVLVPARITVGASMVRFNAEQQIDAATPRIDLGELIELSAATLPMLCAQVPAAGGTALPERVLRVPIHAPPGMAPIPRTHIETAPGRVLADGDSGLTCPHRQVALGVIAPGESLALRYRLGSDPGFSVQRSLPTACLP